MPESGNVGDFKNDGLIEIGQSDLLLLYNVLIKLRFPLVSAKFISQSRPPLVPDFPIPQLPCLPQKIASLKGCSAITQPRAPGSQ
jgi:hypothetical protein